MYFETAAGTWTALWQTDATSTPLQIPGETRHALDVTGQPLAEPQAGALEISVGVAPIYLVP